MFIVESGDIEVEVESVGVVRTYQPGHFFGEKAVLGSGTGTRSATVRCMSTCEEATCFAFGRDAVLDFYGAIKLEVATQEQVCVVSLSCIPLSFQPSSNSPFGATVTSQTGWIRECSTIIASLSKLTPNFVRSSIGLLCLWLFIPLQIPPRSRGLQSA
jgi:hypothetical protein